MKTKIKRKKIISRVSEEDYSRLESIVSDNNFRSVYSLMQYIMYCFLRAVDRERDIIMDSAEEKIIETFNVSYDAEKAHLFVKVMNNIKRKSQQRQVSDTLEMEDLIHDEITEMFEEQAQVGKKLEYGFYLIERREK